MEKHYCRECQVPKFAANPFWPVILGLRGPVLSKNFIRLRENFCTIDKILSAILEKYTRLVPDVE